MGNERQTLPQQKATRKPITISLPRFLSDLLDAELKRLNMRNRSQFIQQLLMDYFSSENTLLKARTVCGVLLVRYRAEITTEEAIQQLQHQHHEIVLYSTHLHINKKECLEIVAVEGNPTTIKHLVDEFRGISEVKYVGTLLQPKS